MTGLPSHVSSKESLVPLKKPKSDFYLRGTTTEGSTAKQEVSVLSVEKKARARHLAQQFLLLVSSVAQKPASADQTSNPVDHLHVWHHSLWCGAHTPTAPHHHWATATEHP
jgi:hypothetical protein